MHFWRNAAKTAMDKYGARRDHGAMERATVPVELNAWIDCPRCGKIHKLSRDFRLPEQIAGPLHEKVRYRCERCGRAEAYLYL